MSTDPPASTSGAICAACGESNPADAKFCGGCGQPLVAEVLCPACGTRNKSGQRFCNGCGQPFGGVQGQRSAPEALLPESFADGRYEVVRFLGEGGRKRVYLARDSRLARDVAIAVFKSEGADERGLVRARREAEAMAKLGDHPNIVTVHDLGEEDGQLYLVSQYMSGGDIEGLLEQAEDRRLAVEEVIRIGGEVARALDHAHGNGVIHRDLKPQNVWLAPDGTAKLGDFGLAMALGQSRLTHEGAMVGTVNYMPPEQGLGSAADERSDIYALGAVMYEMLCGVPPFVGGDAAAVISQHISTAPVGPRWHRADVPVPLEQLVLKMLAKAPEDRPQAASDVSAALQVIGAASGSITLEPEVSAAALGRLTDGTFVGRERELEQLRAAVDEAVSQRGRIVFVTGDPGVGKTRLVSETDTYAGLRGASVLWGTCYEGEGAPAYWPWVQVIRSYVHDHGESDTLAEDFGSGGASIAQLVSELRERLPNLPEPQPLEPDQARFRLFDSIASFLVNVSRRRPLVVALSNLHLADKPSLELLQFVAREVARSRILIVGTYRDDELPREHALNQLVAVLGRERGFARIRLKGLSEGETRAMVEGILRQSLAERSELALVEAIHRESEGTPYFIEEIIRYLIETEALRKESLGRWVIEAGDVSELAIAEGLRDAVNQRVGRLSDECRELLAMAALLGREFSLRLLAVIAASDEGGVRARLQEAIDAAIVSPAGGSQDALAFAHVALRDALYAEVSPDRRVELHRAAGEALEELYGDRIDSHLGEVAYHFAQAAPGGGADKAADYAWWAAEHATALYSYEEAVTHYRRALKLLETLSDEPTRRCELLLALGDVQWRSGDVEVAKSTFADAAQLADRSSLPEQYARAALGRGAGPGGFRVTEMADEQLITLLRASLERLPDRDTALRVQVTARLAVELSYTEDRAEADELSRAAVEMAERVGDKKILLLAMYSRQWSVMGPDRVEEALRASEEIVRLARVASDRDMEFHGHHLKLIALMQLGQMPAVDQEIDACEKVAGDLRQPAYEHQAATFRAMRAIMQGRFKEGERLAQSALQIGQRADREIAAVTFAAQAFLTNWATGTNLEALVEGGRAFAERYSQAWPSALVWLLTETGATDEAAERLRVLARQDFADMPRNRNWLTGMCALAVACTAIGDERVGAILHKLLLPYADQCSPVLAGACCLGSNHAFVGFAAAACGRYEEAIESFERALERNDEIGAQFLAARICYECSRALLARGQSGDAAQAQELIERGLDYAR
jgi:tetratricopeptide (TPR) repeat protein